MLLSADILLDNLPDALDARMTGQAPRGFVLSRPELYEGPGQALEMYRVYVATSESALRSAPAKRGCVFVCKSASDAAERYCDTCCVIEVSPNASFARTFNSLQRVFDVYDEWERDLERTSGSANSINAMLDCAERVFDAPLYVLDASFRVLGMSRAAMSVPDGLRDSATLSPETLGQYLE